jgi:anti-anti-sigma factor
MEIGVERLENGIKKITLRGRMDIEGTNVVDLPLSTETSTEKACIVLDLSELEFMASVGIGVLVRSYKALKLRGGKMVFLNPQRVVELVLERTLVNTLIPICYDMESASRQVLQTTPGE